jgi:hypothetical protein
MMNRIALLISGESYSGTQGGYERSRLHRRTIQGCFFRAEVEFRARRFDWHRDHGSSHLDIGTGNM